MSRYLVTGVAGFIASRVAEMLLEAGHTVIGLDNFSDAYDVRLKNWRLEQLRTRENFQFQYVDISDYKSLALAWRKASPFDAVINLAARAGVRQSVENPWIYIETNATGALNLLELCHEDGINKYVLASSSSLYGSNNTMPYKEDGDTSHPLSPYAASKKAAEALCYSYHHLYGIDITIFRYFTVYGPAGRPDMSIFRFVQWINEGRPVKIFGDGSQSRDYTYVDDIARGTIAGLKPLGYQIINLGSDTPVQLMDIVHVIEEKLGKKSVLEFEPRHPADVQATWANISRAGEYLGWEPQIRYESGIERAIEWYLANREWAQNVVTI